MSTQNKKKSGPAKGIARGKMQAGYDERGNKWANLYRSFSPKLQSSVVLEAEAHYLHHLCCESDPGLRIIRYTQPGETNSWDFRPVLAICNGCLQLRLPVPDKVSPIQDKLLALLAEQKLEEMRTTTHCGFTAVERVVITGEEIVFGNEVRLRNWHRLIPWVSQAQYHPLGVYISAIKMRLKSSGPMSARDIYHMGGADSAISSLHIAAAIIGVGEGVWKSELNEIPFSGTTRFFLRGTE